MSILSVLPQAIFKSPRAENDHLKREPSIMSRTSAELGRAKVFSTEQLSIEGQIELLEELDRRHDEVLKLIDDLEIRVANLLQTWGRPTSAANSPPHTPQPSPQA